MGDQQPPVGSIIGSQEQLGELYRAPSRLVAAKKATMLDGRRPSSLPVAVRADRHGLHVLIAQGLVAANDAVTRQFLEQVYVSDLAAGQPEG